MIFSYIYEIPPAYKIVMMGRIRRARSCLFILVDRLSKIESNDPDVSASQLLIYIFKKKHTARLHKKEEGNKEITMKKNDDQGDESGLNSVPEHSRRLPLPRSVMINRDPSCIVALLYRNAPKEERTAWRSGLFRTVTSSKQRPSTNMCCTSARIFSYDVKWTCWVLPNDIIFYYATMTSFCAGGLLSDNGNDWGIEGFRRGNKIVQGLNAMIISRSSETSWESLAADEAKLATETWWNGRVVSRMSGNHRERWAKRTTSSVAKS